ncbi:MAG: hypothetical protein ISS01_00305 [Nanoarchaeota archaeon]|nr:hypothetical protein [Nanoarchaeota archaeon]
MSTVWFRDLGFYNNPFSIKPAAFHDNVIGYEKVVDEVSYGILNNKLVVLEGEYGNGKSTILRRLLHDFGGKKQVIYYSCNRVDARLNVKKLLNGRYGFLGKLFDMKPKDMILLLDEAQDLGSKDYQKLYSYYQEGFFKSIVLVGKGIQKEDISKEFKPHLKEIDLESVDEETAVKIIKKRVGDLNLLTDSVIKKIFNKSGNNVRLLLKNCEEACKYSVQTGRKKVNEDVLAHIFKEKIELVEEKISPKKVEKKVKKAEVKETIKETVKVKEPMKVKIKEKEEEKIEVKKVVKKKVVKKAVKKKEEEKISNKKSNNVYDPERYKDMMHASAEELLNAPTDDLF